MFFHLVEYITTAIFLIDYISRWIVADMKLKKGKKLYLIYPFTPFAIIDLISIAPIFTSVNQGFKALRMLRAVCCLRVFKMLRYSKSFTIITH